MLIYITFCDITFGGYSHQFEPFVLDMRVPNENALVLLQDSLMLFALAAPDWWQMVNDGWLLEHSWGRVQNKRWLITCMHVLCMQLLQVKLHLKRQGWEFLTLFLFLVPLVAQWLQNRRELRHCKKANGQGGWGTLSNCNIDEKC